MKSGLVSITFRGLGVRAIVDLAREAGLQGIEWGGDVHAPHGDVAAAREAGELTRAAGMEVAAYGSYYRLGPGTAAPRFEDVLASALAMGAPMIRVWAGTKGSAETSEEEFAVVAADARRVASMAKERGLRVGLEYHGGTLTDTDDSTRRLLNAAAHPALRSFWQPPVDMDKDGCLKSLETLVELGKLGSIHVFQWSPGWTRQDLETGAGRWKDYLKLALRAGGERFCCLEHVPNDDPAQAVKDAAVLNGWLKEITPSF